MDDEAGNDAMKNQAVVMAVLNVLNEVGDGFGRAIGEKANLNVAQIGLENDACGGFRGGDASAGARESGASESQRSAKKTVGFHH